MLFRGKIIETAKKTIKFHGFRYNIISRKQIGNTLLGVAFLCIIFAIFISFLYTMDKLGDSEDCGGGK